MYIFVFVHHTARKVRATASSYFNVQFFFYRATLPVYLFAFAPTQSTMKALMVCSETIAYANVEILLYKRVLVLLLFASWAPFNPVKIYI